MAKGKLTTYLLIALLVIVGAYWAYTMFFGQSDSAPTGVVVTDGQGETIPTDPTTESANQFLQILQNINDVTLQDRTLLQNDLFKNKLRDYGKVIEDRPRGRLNPFAPIGVGGMFTGTPGLSGTTTATSS